MNYRVTYSVDGQVRDVLVTAPDETSAILRAGIVATVNPASFEHVEFVSVSNESTGDWWTS